MDRYDIFLFGVGDLYPENKRGSYARAEKDGVFEYRKEKEGYWVKYEDVQKLKAENKKLKEILQKMCHLKVECDYLCDYYKICRSK